MNEDKIVLYYVESFTQAEPFRVFETDGRPCDLNSRFAATREEAVMLAITRREEAIRRYRDDLDATKREIAQLWGLLPDRVKAEEAGRRG